MRAIVVKTALKGLMNEHRDGMCGVEGKNILDAFWTKLDL